MKIRVKYLQELSKEDMYAYTVLNQPLEVTWYEGKVYKVEWL